MTGAARRITRALRYAWASPCTLVGLMLVAPTFLFGARARVVDGVVEIADPLYEAPDDRTWWPFRAITFGHLVIARSFRELDLLRAHEHAHVRQYEQWGILFLAAYPAASLWQLLRGGRPYVDNWFEVQARDKAAREKFK